MNRILASILHATGTWLLDRSLALHNPYVAMAERQAADCEMRRRLQREAEAFGPLHLVDNEERAA